tara:strand:+ start:1244 stop:1408 length:165 start_codon:yes stop_codon:yes gene_type:complete
LGLQGARNPTYLLTGGGVPIAPSDNKVSGGYKKKKRGGTAKKSMLLLSTNPGLH